jgi:hypothetical protein
MGGARLTAQSAQRVPPDVHCAALA